MGIWMRPEVALLRVVEDENAGLMSRVRALEAVAHPPLAVLRRLLVESKTPRRKPVPSKLKSVAAMKYMQEQRLRAERRAMRTKSKQLSGNALGII